MNLNRREFITLSAMVGAAGALAPAARAFNLPDPPQKARLRLSCLESVAPGKTLVEKLDFLEKHGFEGIEPAGTALAGRVGEFQQALAKRKIKISAVSLGYKGWPISEQEQSRRTCVETSKAVLTAAGALGSTGMVMVAGGSKAPQQAREWLVNSLIEMGEHAQKAHTRVLLKPVNRRESYFLRQVADAAAICNDVNSPGVGLAADFWHMTWEEPSDFAAVVAGAKYLHHFHVAGRKERNLPGEDEGDNYVEGFRALKLIGYQDFLSFECRCKGDPALGYPAAVKLLREQWESA